MTDEAGYDCRERVVCGHCCVGGCRVGTVHRRLVIICPQIQVHVFDLVEPVDDPLISEETAVDCRGSGFHQRSDGLELTLDLPETSPVVGLITVRGDVETVVHAAFDHLHIFAEGREGRENYDGADEDASYKNYSEGHGDSALA